MKVEPVLRTGFPCDGLEGLGQVGDEDGLPLGDRAATFKYRCSSAVFLLSMPA